MGVDFEGLLWRAELRALAMPEQLPTVTRLNETGELTRAAAYVRMSTGHQEYSIYNQITAIEQYASAHDLAIVCTYSDEGISGLTIRERPGLRRMVTDIVTGKANFSRVLVYDISRWGRFQDTDESAFYEYVCRMHGIQLIYCAEPFENDHTPLSTVVKAVKRAMAAEYSRELSVKVSKGHFNLARRGYVQGGPAKYGLKHIIVDANGKRIRGRLSDDRKVQRGWRVMLAPGPKKEIETIREIFRRYVELGETTSQIAHYLNSHGFRTRSGQFWDAGCIGSIIVDEQYAGTAVYNKTTTKLKTKRKWNAESEWILRPNAFQPIVDLDVVRQARERRREELRRPSDEELLDKLRGLLKKRGVISGKALYRRRDVPGAGVYVHRFGTIFNAYRLIGYPGGSKNPNWSCRFRMRAVRSRTLDEMRRLLETEQLDIAASATASHFMIGNGVWCTFGVSKSKDTPSGPRWCFRCITKQKAPFHLLGRLDTDDTAILDYYLVPRNALPEMPYRLRQRNGREVDQYRVSTLKAVLARLLRTARPTSRNLALQ